MVEIFGMYQRMGDNIGVCFVTMLLAHTCLWWLRDKLVGHRRTILIVCVCLIVRAVASAWAANDVYFHGRLTQVTSSLLTVSSWGVIGWEIRRNRENIRRTLKASETAEILRVEAQLSGDFLDEAAAMKDNKILHGSRALLNRMRQSREA